MKTQKEEKSFKDFVEHARSIGFKPVELKTTQEDYRPKRQWDEPTEPKRTSHLRLSDEVQKKYDETMTQFKKKTQRSAAQFRMRHKGTVPKRDGNPMFEENKGEVIFQGVPGQTYFVRCPNNARYYRTIYIRQHHMTKEPMGMVSQEVFGDPPSGIKEMSPLAVSRLMRVTDPF